MEEKSNLSQEYDVFDIVFIAMAILLVFNILFLMHKSMSKEQGLLRIIGMKKKEVIMFELLKSLGCIIFSVGERKNSLPTLNFLQKNRNTHQISCII